MTPRQTSCGVIVADAARLLLGHATRSPRWDIPKGLADPGESFAAAAARELAEETGLAVPTAALEGLGVHRYRPGKDLALFAWRPPDLPDTATLRCTSTFVAPDGAVLPELDRFAYFAWEEAPARVGKDLARLLALLRPRFRS